MKTHRFFILKPILWINLICHSTSQLIESENDDIEVVKGSGMDGDLMSANSAYVNFENHIIRYEEKLDAMITTFNQLADNINSLINTNKDLWEKQLQITGDELWTGKMKVSIKTEITDTTQQVIDVQEIRCTDNHFPENCHEVYECLNNVYSIMIPNYSEKPFAAVCDLETSNGGWTIVQRRQDGSQNFYKNWTEYVEGFGNMNGEFFIGLEKLHALTTYGKPQELYIILEDFDGTRKYAKYRTFNVESENTGYKLNVGEYSGDAGDSFSHHNGQKFSTKDRDNDESDTSCAQRLKGGWWYDKCYHCNLNGKYLFGKLPSFKKGQGISWGSFRGYEYSLKFVQMMIRPKD